MQCACNVFGLCVWHFGHLDRKKKKPMRQSMGFRTGKTSTVITRRNDPR